MKHNLTTTVYSTTQKMVSVMPSSDIHIKHPKRSPWYYKFLWLLLIGLFTVWLALDIGVMKASVCLFSWGMMGMLYFSVRGYIKSNVGKPKSEQ
jgi:hypothetical protein